MKIIKEPSRVVLCEKCNAILEFEQKDLKITKFSGGKHGGTAIYVECPCCNSRVWVWNKRY